MYTPLKPIFEAYERGVNHHGRLVYGDNPLSDHHAEKKYLQRKFWTPIFQRKILAYYQRES